VRIKIQDSIDLKAQNSGFEGELLRIVNNQFAYFGGCRDEGV